MVFPLKKGSILEKNNVKANHFLINCTLQPSPLIKQIFEKYRLIKDIQIHP
jgi:hypothetical protein